MIIWLASYPRSGNTLLRIILKTVFERQTFSKHDDANDIGADTEVAAEVGCRFPDENWPAAYGRMRADLNLHLVETHDPPEDDAKAVYIVRDGRSASRSFFHYLKDFPRVEDTFGLTDVVSGFTPFGSWGGHLDAWQPLTRPNTLLMKYEDLLADPLLQIQRLAEFTGLGPLHDWRNDFDKLHKLNPKFFRAGAGNDAATALQGPDLDLFWAQHDDWMGRLGYPDAPESMPAATAVAFRKYLSDKGREFYHLRERVQFAEKSGPGNPEVEAELAEYKHNIAVQMAHADGRMMENRALFAQQLAKLNEAAEKARQDLAEAVVAARTEVDRHRERRVHLLKQLRALRRDSADAIVRAEAATRQADASVAEANLQATTARERTVLVENQTAVLRGRLDAAVGARADLLRRVEESGRESYIAQKQYAESLQEKQKMLTALTTAVGELDHRLQLMMSSRFLRAGWALGFGSAPYWDEASKDELTPLLETVRNARASDPDAAAKLRKLAGLVDRAAPDGNDMEQAVGHLVEKGFNPPVVLDVGSGKGYWSVMASLRWPDARFMMIDPLPDSEDALIKTCRDRRFKYLLMAVGAEPGEAVMNLTPEADGSSLLSPPDPDPRHRLTVPVKTLDQLLESGEIDPPQLVKLDVQGFELKVLDGGQKLFDTADVFIIESNLFEFMPGCPRMHQLVGYMAGRGFYPFDFAGLLRRPFENDLGQVDIVFVRGTHPMVQNIRWVTLETPSAEDRAAARGIETSGSRSIRPAEDAEAADFPALAQASQAIGDGLAVSVVICTRNPVMSILNRTLDPLEKQTLAPDRFELIIVDNNSTPPLTEAGLRGGRTLKFKLISEPTDGLSHARCAGIAAASGELFVFVDDDNFLAPDYLAKAVEIAQAEPRIGLFGGISEVELESPIAKWKRPVLPYLGIRDHGPRPITRYADHWGEWEPIGAGMCARREVAEKFVQMFENSAPAKQLGRCGNALLSGEDSLFARAAHRVGYACSYQPALRLTHFMKKSRLKVRYLAKLLEGHGRSYVLLNRALGKPTEPLKRRTAVLRLAYRLKTKGPAGAITWFWDLGYAAEKRNDPAPVAVKADPAALTAAVPAEGARHGV
jgi:FkbM family methyltransferase